MTEPIESSVEFGGRQMVVLQGWVDSRPRGPTFLVRDGDNLVRHAMPSGTTMAPSRGAVRQVQSELAVVEGRLAALRGERAGWEHERNQAATLAIAADAVQRRAAASTKAAAERQVAAISTALATAEGDADALRRRLANMAEERREAVRELMRRESALFETIRSWEVERDKHRAAIDRLSRQIERDQREVEAAQKLPAGDAAASNRFAISLAAGKKFKAEHEDGLAALDQRRAELEGRLQTIAVAIQELDDRPAAAETVDR